jgi:hypothetical protein
MAGIEIRDYCGDYEDLAELTRRVWLSEYAGRIWAPVPEANFLRSRLAPGTGALCPVAYDGARLVGCVFSIPQSVRIGGEVFPISLFSGFTVDPEHRRLALPLIQRLRRDNEERGMAFGTGMVFDDPSSISNRFWSKYAETYPQNFRFLFRGGYWGKFLGPRTMATAAVQAWERRASRMLGPLLSFTPFGYDPHVRLYRPADLNRCAEMLDKSSTNFDWAMVWTPQELASQLENPEYQTMVFERDGKVLGMVNFHCLFLRGRETINAALIDLWADDGLSAIERVRLLSHVCTHLRERDVHAVVASRCAMMPGSAFVANLFVPHSQHFQVGVFSTSRTIPLSKPKTWSLEIG